MRRLQEDADLGIDMVDAGDDIDQAFSPAPSLARRLEREATPRAASAVASRSSAGRSSPAGPQAAAPPPPPPPSQVLLGVQWAWAEENSSGEDEDEDQDSAAAKPGRSKAKQIKASEVRGVEQCTSKRRHSGVAKVTKVLPREALACLFMASDGPNGCGDSLAAHLDRMAMPRKERPQSALPTANKHVQLSGPAREAAEAAREAAEDAEAAGEVAAPAPPTAKGNSLTAEEAPAAAAAKAAAVAAAALRMAPHAFEEEPPTDAEIGAFRSLAKQLRGTKPEWAGGWHPLTGVGHGSLHAGNVLLDRHSTPWVVGLGRSAGHAYVLRDAACLEVDLLFRMSALPISLATVNAPTSTAERLADWLQISPAAGRALAAGRPYVPHQLPSQLWEAFRPLLGGAPADQDPALAGPPSAWPAALKERVLAGMHLRRVQQLVTANEHSLQLQLSKYREITNRLLNVEDLRLALPGGLGSARPAFDPVKEPSHFRAWTHLCFLRSQLPRLLATSAPAELDYHPVGYCLSFLDAALRLLQPGVAHLSPTQRDWARAAAAQAAKRCARFYEMPQLAFAAQRAPGRRLGRKAQSRRRNR